MLQDKVEFAIRKLDGPNGLFFRIVERKNGGSWLMAAGSIDYDREQDAQYWITERNRHAEAAAR